MSKYHEQFLKNTPLGVLSVLRELHHHQLPVSLSWPGGQLISRILSLALDTIVLDHGSQAEGNRLVTQAEKVEVSAETQGAKVEFTLQGLRNGEFDGLPAFSSPMPQSLWFIQRRAWFRVNTPLTPPWRAKASLPDGSLLTFQLCDLSLGGLGGLVDGTLSGEVKAGMQFSRVEVDMVEWGRHRLDMQLLAISERRIVNSKNETRVTPRLSFRFINLSPTAERDLQRIIFALEKAARQKASQAR